MPSNTMRNRRPVGDSYGFDNPGRRAAVAAMAGQVRTGIPVVGRASELQLFHRDGQPLSAVLTEIEVQFQLDAADLLTGV